MDKGEIERELRKVGSEWVWRADGGLCTIRRGPGVRIHPETNEEVWSNHAHLFHPSDLPAAVQQALLRSSSSSSSSSCSSCSLSSSSSSSSSSS
eukprot:CAMPEP_0201510844 /NCGR_PEP_ID=MMETSP0161_2-20130828/3384_1 /ASSEMBLY_ACC=CAM_ASM_000251 /TAXON_ID=180227 /ORGANISM="Neoparamoeba aestuarina, Strain SoJaBio B1-5/56/2" /LENGTH=93 /DNA_ID=CAMNT_0047906097 /DNA_START=666 /DNA_END=943 /DNA_ORIENTATION=-